MAVINRWDEWLLLLIIAGVAVWWFTRDPVEVAYQKCLKDVATGVEKSTAMERFPRLQEW